MLITMEITIRRRLKDVKMVGTVDKVKIFVNNVSYKLDFLNILVLQKFLASHESDRFV